ncbi:MAG TPA: hypothetical protein VKE49_12160, partial [Myxococcaceae bacterium]|nr:hypothetical protein [Myxococcaceae bacterium]
ISAWREHATNAVFLILSAGTNVHFAQPRSSEGAMPIAVQLRRSEKWLVSLAPAYEGGMAWNCQGPGPDKIECGAHPVHGTYSPARPSPSYIPQPSNSAPPQQRFVSLWPQPSRDGFNGIFYVGRVTAAPPAAEPGKKTAKE